MPRSPSEVISEAAKELEDEIAYLDGKVQHLEGRLESCQIERDQLLSDIAEQQEYIQSLETALAEACLMSKEDEAAKT